MTRVPISFQFGLDSEITLVLPPKPGSLNRRRPLDGTIARRRRRVMADGTERHYYTILDDNNTAHTDIPPEWISARRQEKLI